MDEALVWAVENDKIGYNVPNKVLMPGLAEGYENEGGDSLADLVNAITRGAWVASFKMSERADLERDAGSLVPLFAEAVQDSRKVVV